MSEIIEAVGTAVGHGTSGDATLGDRVQKAMEQAVIEALAEGVSINNSEEILRRKMDAKDRVIEGYGR